MSGLDPKSIFERAGLTVPGDRTAADVADLARRQRSMHRDLRPQPSFVFATPDFDPAFQNWLGVAANFPAIYWAGIDGAVHLSGLVGPTGTYNFAANMPIVRLPGPFRPTVYTQGPFVVESSGGGVIATCQLQVTTDGWVRVGSRGGAANPIDWIALAGVLFRTV